MKSLDQKLAWLFESGGLRRGMSSRDIISAMSHSEIDEDKSTKTQLHYGPAGAVGQKNWEKIKKAAVYRSHLKDDPQHFAQLNYYDDATDSAMPLPIKLDKEQVVSLYKILRDMFRSDQSNVERAYLKLATLKGISDLLHNAKKTNLTEDGDVEYFLFKDGKPISKANDVSELLLDFQGIKDKFQTSKFVVKMRKCRDKMVGRLQEENTKQVYVLMQNNNPVVKFDNEHEANQAAQELQKKFPAKKITVVSKPAVKQMYEGEVLAFKRKKPVKQQYGTRVFPPSQRNVDEPEGNITPIKVKPTGKYKRVGNTMMAHELSDLFEGDVDYHTAVELAKEMYQDIQDLLAITQSGSKIAAGNPHNVQSLTASIQELDQELVNLGYYYDPMARDLIRKK